jgi:hypothetical protein
MAAKMKSTPPTELAMFHRFVTESLENGSSALSPEEILSAFRAHQRDLQRLRKAVQPSLARSLCGESRQIDLGKLKAKVTRRLAKRGSRVWTVSS